MSCCHDGCLTKLLSWAHQGEEAMWRGFQTYSTDDMTIKQAMLAVERVPSHGSDFL
jgi:hypothetical protein